MLCDWNLDLHRGAWSVSVLFQELSGVRLRITDSSRSLPSSFRQQQSYPESPSLSTPRFAKSTVPLAILINSINCLKVRPITHSSSSKKKCQLTSSGNEVALRRICKFDDCASNKAATSVNPVAEGPPSPVLIGILVRPLSFRHFRTVMLSGAF